MARIYYNVQLNGCISSEEFTEAKRFRNFLKDAHYKYEASDCSVKDIPKTHFEVLLNPAELEICNQFLDTL